MKKFISILMLTAFAVLAFSQKQDDPVMFEINGQSIRRSEFMKEFLQSIGKDPSAPKTACTYEKRLALEEYVELFANFRAKLADAYAQGYDTMPSLRKELGQYRNELASPYLMDSTTLNEILKEAYERNHYIVRAAHILVRCDQNATATDTLLAYNRAMELYNRALKGENFNELAWNEEQKTSMQMIKDEKLKKNPNAGELGYFTVFDMVYPFECAVYSITPGTISKPVRTRFGYHVIKLYDKKTFYGESKIQHIWVRGDQDTIRGRSKIMEAYQSLIGGDSFESVAKNYSDDRTTYNEGGRLPMLPVTKLPSEYVEKIANGMRDGEYTKPFHTQYGWHIVKLLHHEEIPSFEDMLPLYKQRLTRDLRSSKPKDRYIADIKKKYNFVDYTKIEGKGKKPKATLDPLIKIMNDSIYAHKWDYDTTAIKGANPLFSLNGKDYTLKDVAEYMKATQSVSVKRGYAEYVNQIYGQYIDNMVMKCADENLERDNPEFAALLNEYRNGLMIFAYNDENIWSKAIKDTSGFKVFYLLESAKKDINNPADSNYFWNERARTTVVKVANSSALAPEKALKIIDKAYKKKLSQSELRTLLQKAVDKKSQVANPIDVSLEVYEEGHQKVLSRNEWRKGSYVHSEGTGYSIYVVEQIINPALKTSQEARGYYITDYQNEIERELNEHLRHKYHVKIYRDVVDETTY